MIGKTTINHYIDGLRSSSKEAIENKTFDKPLEDMSISELDLALSLIYSSDWFIKKDKKGNKMYSNALKRFRGYKHLFTDQVIEEEKQVVEIKNDNILTETEKTTLINARVGQGKYRDLLIKNMMGSVL